MNNFLSRVCVFGLLMCYQINAIAVQVYDLELTLNEVEGKQTVFFENYDSVIAFMEAHQYESQLLDDFGRNTALKILKQESSDFNINLEPLRDYQSPVSEVVWRGLNNKLSEQSARLNCGASPSAKCRWLEFLSISTFFELFLAQAKQVYYQTSNSDKAAAHKRAVATFSIIKKRLATKTLPEDDLNYLSVKFYLLAHELTNDIYYKTIFMQKVDLFLSLHFYGEEQFIQKKASILATHKSEVIAQSEQVRLSLPEKYRSIHDLKFYLNTALTRRFVAEFAHLIDDEKGRLLGDEWKLYNNAVPFFERALSRALVLLDTGKTLNDIGWSKMRLVNRNLKIKAYSAKSNFEFIWGKYKLDRERFFEQVSKQSGWKTLAPFLASDAINLYRNRSAQEHIIVDGKDLGKVLDHTYPYL